MRQNRAYVFAGDLFEIFALERLRCGGKFRRKRLDTGVIDEISLEKTKLVLVKEYNAFGLELNTSVYVSTRSNEAAVDFVSNAHLINATISIEHDFKVNGTSAQWLSKLDQGENWDICYAVPDDLLESYPKQSVKQCLPTLKKKRARDDEEISLIKKIFMWVEDFPQYAIGITLN
jgi:hypothetical protein